MHSGNIMKCVLMSKYLLEEKQKCIFAYSFGVYKHVESVMLYNNSTEDCSALKVEIFVTGNFSVRT